jgi:hypothetical protein
LSENNKEVLIEHIVKIISGRSLSAGVFAEMELMV